MIRLGLSGSQARVVDEAKFIIEVTDGVSKEVFRFSPPNANEMNRWVEKLGEALNKVKYC